MNSIGVTQAVTDKDRAKILLSYYCVSLTDLFWIRRQGEKITFKELNLYDNPLNEAIAAVEKIGLRQIHEMDMSKFGGMEQEAEMFQLRLRELKKHEGQI